MNAGPYRLTFAPSARRDLAERLPEGVATAAIEFIVGTLHHQPKRVGKQLQAPLDDRWSARRGTYRVLYTIDDAARKVRITAILPRADAYRPH